MNGWPRWLANMPSTNVLISVLVALVLGTAVRALGPKWVCGPVPDQWYSFMQWFGVTVVGQFAAKRMTHKEGANANGNGQAPS